MNWKKIARSALCLLVVCALLVNISPIKAKAFGAEYILYVAAKAVLTGLLIGLGIGFTEDVLLPSGESFLQALEDFIMVNYPGVSEDGRIRVYNTSFVGNPDFPYAVDASLIELIREWIFANGVVESYPVGVITGSTSSKMYNYEILISNSGVPFYQILKSISDGSKAFYTAYYDSTYYCYYFTEAGQLRFDGFSKLTDDAFYGRIADISNLEKTKTGYGSSLYRDAASCPVGSYVLDFDKGGSSCASSGSYGISLYGKKKTANGYDSSVLVNFQNYRDSSTGSNLASHFGLYSIMSSCSGVLYDYGALEGVELEYIADPDVPLGEGYEEWRLNAITIPSGISGLDSDVLAYPIGLGGSLSDTLNFSQQDIWNGRNEYVWTPDAQIAEVFVDLNRSPVTYEVGESVNPLVIHAISTDGGILSYQWYQVSKDDMPDRVIPGAISPRYTPKSDTVGTFQYYCAIHNLVDNGTTATVNSSVATITIVEAGSSTGSDVLTQEGLDSAVNDINSANASWFSSTIDAIKSVPQTILDGIAAIFVPSEDFLSAKVESLRGEFGFVDSVINTGNAIGAALMDFETSPPIIYMELSNAESKYDWGDRAIALDLRWYERYKPTVDQLLSALLWLWFAWRVFRKLPDIISGVSGDVPDGHVSEGSFIRVGYASDRRRLPPGK